MKTKDVSDKAGRPFAFEVSNTFLTRREVRSVLWKVPGAQMDASINITEDEFGACQLNGRTFVAWEPYGDNSVFWVGPKPPEWNPDIELVRKAFQEFRPFWGILKWVPLAVAFGAAMIKLFARNG